MQVTIDQIVQLINPSREVSDAFAVAKNTAVDVAGAVSGAMGWLELQYDAVSPIGTVDIFEQAQTAETWAADRNRYNVAMVEVARVARILGVQ